MEVGVCLQGDWKMKRLFCLCLCALVLCAAALAEATTYDFGEFTIDAPAGAFVQQMEKTENAAFFAVLPNYDASQLFQDSYSVAWMRADFSASLFQTDATALAQALIDASTGPSSAGVETSNGRLLAAAYGEDGDSFCYYAAMDVDHAGAGVDLQYTMYCAQAYVDFGDEAGYIFSFKARDAEGLEALVAAANITPRA